MTTRRPADPFRTPSESIRTTGSETSSLRDRIEEFREAAAVAVTTAEYNEKRAPFERFVSYRLQGEFPRPWLEDKRWKRTRRNDIMVGVMLVIALGLSAFIAWDGAKNVKNHDYCLVMEDNFETFNTDNWSHEVQLDGMGTGNFDWVTDSDKVTFVDNEGLHIVPQLTTEVLGISESQLLDGYTVNLTKAGLNMKGSKPCTDPEQTPWKCSISSDKKEGRIINPVMSARLTTKGKKKIRYGKVEVTAKMPKGDWLWPAIWMMPQDEKYGYWPRSGEIDIAESRGNGYEYENGGRDTYTSVIHYGPDAFHNGYFRNIAGRKLRRTDFSEEFHTFGLEWSEDYLFTYVDSRIQQVLKVYFIKENMWQRGQFAGAMTENNTFFVDPWSQTGRKNTPFDEDFYLILNVAVGSRNGWFLDGIGGKPWVDASPTAPKDFWEARDFWLPTWAPGTGHGMTVKSVKMWQEGKCGGGK